MAWVEAKKSDWQLPRICRTYKQADLRPWPINSWVVRRLWAELDGLGSGTQAFRGTPGEMMT